MVIFKCPKCGAILSQNERELQKCNSCGEKIANEVREEVVNTSKENVMGYLLKSVAIFILVIGTVINGINCYNASEFRYELFLSREFTVIVYGLLLLGLSEIIKLLTLLYEKKSGL